MKYFVPAWYIEKKWWRSHARPYYDNVYSKSEFDDMVSLMGMYFRNNSKFKMLILNHFPDLRTFLHRNQLFECSYWSVFDEIQLIQAKEPNPININDLNWPENTSFIYTPYVVRCIISNSEFETIHFSPIGYIVWIDHYLDNKRVYRSVYDDRGFVSQRQHYGEDEYIEYLTETGEVILTERIESNDVYVAQKFIHRFDYSHYSSMVEVIKEYLSKYVNKEYKMIAASDINHNDILNSLMMSCNLTYSIFDQRNSDNLLETIPTMEHANHWVVDLKKNESKLKRKHRDLMRITPFNTQSIISLSNQLYTTHIGLNIDDLEQNRLLFIIDLLFEFIREHDDMKVQLMTRNSKSNFNYLNDKIDEINEYFIELEDDKEILNDEMREKKKVIEVISLPFEVDVIQCIKKLRLMIDLKDEPDLFLQICAISAGIPQINNSETDYVVQRMNGLIVEHDEQLTDALKYYLTVLKHWNVSRAFTFELVKHFSSERIIEKLDSFIEGAYYEENI